MHVARIVKKLNSYRIWVGNHEGKRSLGRPTYRWEDNITVNLREIEWGCVDWIDLT